MMRKPESPCLLGLPSRCCLRYGTLAGWPAHLTHSLAAVQLVCEPPLIIAKSGWTTDELDLAIDEASPDTGYHLVRRYSFCERETEGSRAE